MTEKNKLKSLTGKNAESIREEINVRVMDRYAELKGLEKNELELSATLTALSEITDIPLSEIESIAKEVQDQYPAASSTSTTPDTTNNTSAPNTLIGFERLNERDELHRRRFLVHLVPFIAINSMLIYLNIYSSSFPWAMFPVLGWGIGLVSHYLTVVRWPQKTLDTKIRQVKDQIDIILRENWRGYTQDKFSSEFNGLYRLTVTLSSREIIEEYLGHCDSALSPETISMISAQLVAIQQEISARSLESNKARDPFNVEAGRRPGNRSRRYPKHRR